MDGKEVKITGVYSFEKRTSLKLPYFITKISAGFPSPAGDYEEKKLDLNEFLVKHPSATFFIKVSGDSMIGAGIHSGDLLIVDRSLEPSNNKIAIVVLDGEFTVKRIFIKKDKLLLLPENPDFKPIEVTPEMNCEIWGIVTFVIHQL
ncbi:translesion error-prone DNA polymerase V autoproteolytic subunit [candidate division WOR-3 bacterium]|nr:translesion error-prone DNA polymerase V autoproteolytic subunit [candidate division WOR-3 bacterium]